MPSFERAKAAALEQQPDEHGRNPLFPKNPGPQTDRVLRVRTPAMEGPTPAMESPRILRVGVFLVFTSKKKYGCSSSGCSCPKDDYIMGLAYLPPHRGG